VSGENAAGGSGQMLGWGRPLNLLPLGGIFLGLREAIMLPFWIWLIIGLLLFDVAVYAYVVSHINPRIRDVGTPLPRQPEGQKHFTAITAIRIALLILMGLPFLIFCFLPCIGIITIYVKIKAGFLGKAQ